MERLILNVHLRGKHALGHVEAALAKGLGLAPGNLPSVEAEDAETQPILLDHELSKSHRPRAFRTAVTAYVDPTSGLVARDLELGRILAKALLTDALAPVPDGEDPYQWLLIKPDGRVFEVSEVPDETEEADDVVIDDAPALLRPFAG
jgi:hypothetical protein